MSFGALKSSQANDLKSVKILFGAFPVIKRSQAEILGLPFYRTPNNYLKKFLGDRSPLKIGLRDELNNLISLPVRGLHCTHPEVFGLESFIMNTEDLEEEVYFCCFICGKK